MKKATDMISPKFSHAIPDSGLNITLFANGMEWSIGNRNGLFLDITCMNWRYTQFAMHVQYKNHFTCHCSQGMWIGVRGQT